MEQAVGVGDREGEDEKQRNQQAQMTSRLPDADKAELAFSNESMVIMTINLIVGPPIGLIALLAVIYVLPPFGGRPVVTDLSHISTMLSATMGLAYVVGFIPAFFHSLTMRALARRIKNRRTLLAIAPLSGFATATMCFAAIALVLGPVLLVTAPLELLKYVALFGLVGIIPAFAGALIAELIHWLQDWRRRRKNELSPLG